MTLAERLTYAREHSGLSQSQVAKMLEKSRSTVWRWEVGETEPTVEECKQAAHIYRVSECWLLTGEVNPNTRKGFAEILTTKMEAARKDLEDLITLLERLEYEGDDNA